MRHAPVFVPFLFASACATNVGTVEVSITGDVAEVPEAASENALALSQATGDGVHVTVNDVEVAIVDDDEPAESGWVTIFEGAEPLDLLATDATGAFLAAAKVPAGRITQVRLVLSPDPTITIDGETFDLGCPSCTPSGLKLVPHGTLVVPDGGFLDLDVVVDLRASLHRDPTGYWIQPVVRL